MDPKTQVARRGAVAKSSESSNELTALVPESRDRINPVAYMRWRDEVIAHEMGERVWGDK